VPHIALRQVGFLVDTQPMIKRKDVFFESRGIGIGKIIGDCFKPVLLYSTTSNHLINAGVQCYRPPVFSLKQGLCNGGAIENCGIIPGRET
jgi:hypothetical protein